MYIIRVEMRCPDERSEVLSNELDIAECIVEERIGLALLELFGRVLVDCVNIEYLPFQDVR